MSDDMLVKHMLGEASPAEQQAVEDWVAASGDNSRYYDQFRLIWEQSKNLDIAGPADTDAAWDRFMNRVAREEEAEASASARRTIPLRPSYPLMRVAAMLVVLIGAGWLIYTAVNGDNDNMTVASADKVLKHTLPDGSIVTLNRNSTLAYHGDFNRHSRNVTLSGEAFFEVAPDKSKPFVIDAGNTSVTVVGTTFNVKSRKDITEVVVESGIVEVAKKQKAVRLMPGQKATVSAASDAPVAAESTDVLYNYYRTNEFVCDNLPIFRLVSILNEAYGVQIEITDPKLATLPINTTFRTQNLDEILDILGKTFKDQMRIEHNGKKIVLKSR